MKGAAESLDRLIKELDRKRLSVSVAEALVDLGDVAFARIVEQIRARTYSDRQAANAVAVLLRMAGGPLRSQRVEIARLLVQTMADEGTGDELRSAAVWGGMVLCMIAEGATDEDLMREHQNLLAAMRRAILQGVNLNHRPRTSINS